MRQVIFNDGVLRAILMDSGWVGVEWLTNEVGYLSKTVVKDLKMVEKMCAEHGWAGWALGSENEHTTMHQIIEKFGGQVHSRDKEMTFYTKRILCAEQ